LTVARARLFRTAIAEGDVMLRLDPTTAGRSILDREGPYGKGLVDVLQAELKYLQLLAWLLHFFEGDRKILGVSGEIGRATPSLSRAWTCRDETVRK
jgi:hypothetical protein